MTDAELTNAINLHDDLAKKINDAQQQIDEWQRELDRVKAFIAQLEGSDPDNDNSVKVRRALKQHFE